MSLQAHDTRGQGLEGPIELTRRQDRDVKLLSRIQSRLDTLRMPYVTTIRDFVPSGVRFEISNSVERYRVLEHGGEKEYLRAMLATLRPGDVMYDVGVCVGLVTLHAAHICRVVGFEPDPSFRVRVSRNLALNGQLPIQVHPFAIGDEDIRMPLFTDGASGNSPSLRRQRGERSQVDVEVRTLDALIFEDGLPHPSAIKLDIEGAEILALRGARRLLASDRRPRLLFLEVHHTLLSAFGATSQEVMDLVEDAGYRTKCSIDRADQTLLILTAKID